ncbi:Ribosome biogenesis protein TSR3 [Cyphellophora attinorum]|uniref:Ribosome biogenesis protein TSR3 n=1 Tax=Cyphellophora attinorum TaxID=1664694 RepID=A0A0N0NHQ3_9EURO|nr:Ribosome biogenesis protein TSR3 [Phialophora attinorum]KPI34951.1 Ribosome biogenesis protein TSR3 [Phialophora attinorum]
MVRHKKDGMSSKSKKFSSGHSRHTPRNATKSGDTDLDIPVSVIDENGEPTSTTTTTGSAKPPFKAACWDFNHCDSKRCSGKRLMHFGLMREMAVGQKFPGVVISPNAKKVVSPADRELLEQHGAAVVECSWVRIKEIPWARIGGKCERLLPYLVAANPPFLEINSQLFARYQKCKDEEEVKKAEENWMKKLDREYERSRKEGEEGGDAWAGGNLNRQEVYDESSEEDDQDEDEDEEDEDGGFVQQGVSLDLPPDEEDEEEEAMMAEIRRKVLASKPFQDPGKMAKEEKSEPVDAQRSDAMLKNEPPGPPLVDSDEESGSDEDFDDFNKIVNATPVTDRTGIVARERAKKLEVASASFQREVISAPKRW